jgi:hypothetical protein
MHNAPQTQSMILFDARLLQLSSCHVSFADMENLAIFGRNIFPQDAHLVLIMSLV